MESHQSGKLEIVRQRVRLQQLVSHIVNRKVLHAHAQTHNKPSSVVDLLSDVCQELIQVYRPVYLAAGRAFCRGKMNFSSV